MTERGRGYFTTCVTCNGAGMIARSLMGGDTPETCPTCHGERVYDWRKGPGVDHDRPHGTGRQPDA